MTNHGIAIQEALLGTGIALGWDGVIDDLLARKALVRVHDEPIRSERGYYLVRPRNLPGSDRHEWLFEVLHQQCS